MSHEFEAPEVDTSGLTNKQRFGLIFGLVLIAAVVIFVIQNTESTDIDWLFFSAALPLWLTVLGSIVVGGLLTEIALFFVRRRRGE